jgi:HD-GYP domain-containing protein (c-di-GMP phosphodiesterase class II)
VNHGSVQLDHPSFSETLFDRYAALGLPVITLDRDGQVIGRCMEHATWLGSLVAGSPMLERELGRRVRQWLEQPGMQNELLWPGCWALPLPVGRRRNARSLSVAILISDAIVDSEQFHRICDAAGIDYQVACSRIDASERLSPEAVHRLTQAISWGTQDANAAVRHQADIDMFARQLSETYEELSLVYRLSANMTVKQDPEQFLYEACEELQQVAGLRWTAIILSTDEQRLQNLQGTVVSAGKGGPAPEVLQRLGGQLLERFGEHDQPIIIDQTAEADLPLLSTTAECALIVPVIRESRALGVLIGADKITAKELTTVDSKLVTSVAQSIGVFLNNVMLYDDVQKMFMGTLRALVSAIDAKDSYTRGHSERVAWLSRSLGQMHGLDEAASHRVYLAGLLHDIGKIGIPESVLTKPGRLTDEEFAMIKTHPRIGARILEGIRQMEDLLPGVLCHHERWDGRGYPQGLAGEAIPIFGRLICLADSFDAMSSDRTYRSALQRQQVLDEIRRCAGQQFDPNLAELFVQIDFAPLEEMLDEHRQRVSPLNQEMEVGS